MGSAGKRSRSRSTSHLLPRADGHVRVREHPVLLPAGARPARAPSGRPRAARIRRGAAGGATGGLRGHEVRGQDASSCSTRAERCGTILRWRTIRPYDQADLGRVLALWDGQVDVDDARAHREAVALVADVRRPRRHGGGGEGTEGRIARVTAADGEIAELLLDALEKALAHHRGAHRSSATAGSAGEGSAASCRSARRTPTRARQSGRATSTRPPTRTTTSPPSSPRASCSRPRTANSRLARRPPLGQSTGSTPRTSSPASPRRSHGSPRNGRARVRAGLGPAVIFKIQQSGLRAARLARLARRARRLRLRPQAGGHRADARARLAPRSTGPFAGVVPGLARARRAWEGFSGPLSRAARGGADAVRRRDRHGAGAARAGGAGRGCLVEPARTPGRETLRAPISTASRRHRRRRRGRARQAGPGEPVPGRRGSG